MIKNITYVERKPKQYKHVIKWIIILGQYTDIYYICSLSDNIITYEWYLRPNKIK